MSNFNELLYGVWSNLAKFSRIYEKNSSFNFVGVNFAQVVIKNIDGMIILLSIAKLEEVQSPNPISISMVSIVM